MLTVAQMTVDSLSPYHRNPRRGNVDAIAESLLTNGQYKPITVNRGDLTGRPLEILAGNHTWRAAGLLGWETIDVVLVDVDDQQAARIVAADNRTADMGTYDQEALRELLGELPDLTGTGYDDEDIERLLRRTELSTIYPDANRNHAPKLPEEPRTQLGDIWLMGPHRLVCGDSTDPLAVDMVMAERRADLLWTDPPYPVKATPELPQLIYDVVSMASIAVKQAAPYYVMMPRGPLLQLALTALAESQMDVRQMLVWLKDEAASDRFHWHNRHELIAYGQMPGVEDFMTPWYGSGGTTSVLEPNAWIDSPHPGQKPVELVTEMLDASLPHGGVVYDPLAGTGTTMVAAEGLGSVAYMIELDPRYCDVITDRWEALTGQPATREEPTE